MRFIDFKDHFKKFTVFATHDIAKWDPAFDSRRLVEWQQKGYLKKIINRWYIFEDEQIDEVILYLVANRIYTPSYISFESALAHYGLIPEAVFTLTSATNLKTNKFNTPVGSFYYRHLKPDLFFGYALMEDRGKHYRMAEPEKVILDYLYMHAQVNTPQDFLALRWNQVTLRTLINHARLMDYLTLFKSKALEKRIATFLNTCMYA